MNRILVAYDLNLPCLQLNDFGLSSIPAELGDLSALQSFVLSDNKLIFIPPEFGNLLILQYLDFSDNKLILILPELGNLLILEEFYLYNNCLTSVPEEIVALTTLIKAGGNYFDEYYLGDKI